MYEGSYSCYESNVYDAFLRSWFFFFFFFFFSKETKCIMLATSQIARTTMKIEMESKTILCSETLS
jgi:hypothetical protein